MNRTPTPRHLLSILGAGDLLAACASTPQLDAQGADPGPGSHSALLHRAKVLVACDAFDVAIRQADRAGLF